jgi:hypothetical protein
MPKWARKTYLNRQLGMKDYTKLVMLPHRNIHKYNWTFADGKTHNQIEHILVKLNHLYIVPVAFKLKLLLKS